MLKTQFFHCYIHIFTFADEKAINFDCFSLINTIVKNVVFDVKTSIMCKTVLEHVLPLMEICRKMTDFSKSFKRAENIQVYSLDIGEYDWNSLNEISHVFLA